MATGDLVVIENYKEWRQAVKKLDSGLDKEVKAGMRQIGKEVSTQAKAIAGTKGLMASGELIRKIAPSVRLKDVVIVEKAKRPAAERPGLRKGKTTRNPYPYPAVYEYGGRSGGNATGPRAFLGPAIDASMDDIREGIERIMDETARKAGWK